MWGGRGWSLLPGIQGQESWEQFEVLPMFCRHLVNLEVALDQAASNLAVTD